MAVLLPYFYPLNHLSTRLGEHKYSSSGSTLLDPIMQKFWNWFVAHCIPRWWAPNAMTLVGLVFNLFTCSLLVYYSPDARQEVNI